MTRRGSKATVLAAALCLTALPAAAQVTPENFAGGRTSDLAALCAAGPSDPNAVSAVNFCHGYLMAIAQFHAELTREDGPMNPFFCLARPLPTVSAITAGFVTWARANPQYAQSSAAEGVVRFASDTNPCPQTPAATGRRARRAQ
jgi:hypothetical protein